MADKPPPQLSREQLERFVVAVEKRRRVLLTGYLVALVVMIGAIVGAFAAYVSLHGNRFRTLVFFVPFALTGGVLWYFGRRARQIRP